MSAWTQKSVDKVLAVNKNPKGIWTKSHTSFLFLNIEDEDVSDLDLSGIFFYKCNLQKTRFNRSTLNNLVLKTSDCREACFDGATLDGARFENFSFLDGASFIGASLKKAHLEMPQDVTLIDVDLSTAEIIECVSFDELHRRLAENQLQQAGMEEQYKYFLVNVS